MLWWRCLSIDVWWLKWMFSVMTWPADGPCGRTRLIVANVLKFKEQYRASWEWKKVARQGEVDSDKMVLKNKLLLEWTTFHKTFMELHRIGEVSCFSMFKFEPLHNLSHVISNLAKDGTVNYFLSDWLIMEGMKRKGKSFVKTFLWVLRRCNLLLNTIGHREDLLGTYKRFVK